MSNFAIVKDSNKVKIFIDQKQINKRLPRKVKKKLKNKIRGKAFKLSIMRIGDDIQFNIKT